MIIVFLNLEVDVVLLVFGQVVHVAYRHGALCSLMLVVEDVLFLCQWWATTGQCDVPVTPIGPLRCVDLHSRVNEAHRVDSLLRHDVVGCCNVKFATNPKVWARGGSVPRETVSRGGARGSDIPLARSMGYDRPALPEIRCKARATLDAAVDQHWPFSRGRSIKHLAHRA